MTPDRRREAQTSNPFAVSGETPALNLNDLMQQMIGQPVSSPPPQSLAPSGPVVQGGELVVGKFRITKIGLRIDGSVTPAEWLDFGTWVRGLSSALTWVIADWMAYGQRAHGTSIEDTAALIGKSVKTLYNWGYVSGNVDISRRRENLTFSHHALVAALSPDQQSWYLEQAEAHSWSVAQLKRQIEDAQQQHTVTARPASYKRQIAFIERILDAVQRGESVDPRHVSKLRTYAMQVNQWTGEVLRWLEEADGDDTA